jgi:tetratricopeptide (TPR) repeat protein
MLLALTVIGSLLAVGTVHVKVLLFVAPVALLGAACVLFAEDDWKASMPGAAWVLGGLSLYSLLQSLPIPWSWLHRLSRVSAQTWADARQIIGGHAHRAASISIDPGASRFEALKWLSYAAVFITAAALTRRTGAKRGLGLVVAAALLGGTLTIIHGLLGLEKWLGLYKPSFSGPPWALSPLLNANNYSGYLNIATFCAIGLAMTGRPPAPRWALGLVAAILFALSFLTGSRGGVLALLIGMVLVSVALREQASRARRQGAPMLPSWLPIAGMFAVGSLLFLLGSNNVIWEQLLDETTSKIRIVEWTAPMILDHRWFGVGRGAYETASSAYRATPGLFIYQHAENFLADWLAEWGIPVALIGLLSLMWLLRPKRLGFLRHPLPTAAIIGIAALLLQNLVDLGLEIAAVGIAAFTILGSLWGGATRDAERRHERAEKRQAKNDDEAPAEGEFQSGPVHDRPSPQGSRSGKRRNRKLSRLQLKDRRISQGALIRTILWMTLGLALVALVGFSSQPDAAEQRLELHDAFAGVKWSEPSQSQSFRRKLAQAIERHPGDPYLPVLGALAARDTGGNALVWINQALRRDPINARAELLLADVLASRGHVRQALVALRSCVKHEPWLAEVAAQRATLFTHSLDDLQLAVPEGADGIGLLNALAMNFVKPEQRSTHEALLQLSFERSPSAPATHAIVVDDLLRDLDDPKGPCQGDARPDCEARLRKHAGVIEALGPKNLQAVLLHARLLTHDSKLEEAAKWLAKRCQEFTSDATCASSFVNVAARVPNPALLEEASSTYLALACSTPDACSSAATWIGDLFMARGNFEHALNRYERAANEAPSAEAWQRVANAALNSGHVTRAQSALIAARRFGASPDSDIDRQVEQARRAQLLRDALKR